MIWIIAGTKSARELADFLLDRGLSVVASATTSYGAELLGDREGLTVIEGKLQTDDMEKLIGHYKVSAIIDASHPYAVEVKGNVMAAAEKMSVPCIRYEREDIEIEDAVKFSTYEDAAAYIKNLRGNILMTIGSQNLDFFREKENQKIYARVLPMESSIRQCSEAGYSPERIIAMQSIFSRDFNISLMKELDIKYMVTKESGSEGGVMEKIEAARELGIEIIVMERPKYGYEVTLYSAEEIYKRIGDL